MFFNKYFGFIPTPVGCVFGIAAVCAGIWLIGMWGIFALLGVLLIIAGALLICGAFAPKISAEAQASDAQISKGAAPNAQGAVSNAQSSAALALEAARLEKNGDFSHAAELLRQALEYDDNAALWARLGHICRAQRNFSSACRCYEHAISLDPSFAAAHGNLGALLIMQGDFNRAKIHMKQAVELSDEQSRDYPALLANYALTLGKCGDTQSASELLDKAQTLGYPSTDKLRDFIGL